MRVADASVIRELLRDGLRAVLLGSTTFELAAEYHPYDVVFQS
jgi:hypothetical protein